MSKHPCNPLGEGFIAVERACAETLIGHFVTTCTLCTPFAAGFGTDDRHKVMWIISKIDFRSKMILDDRISYQIGRRIIFSISSCCKLSEISNNLVIDSDSYLTGSISLYLYSLFYITPHPQGGRRMTSLRNWEEDVDSHDSKVAWLRSTGKLITIKSLAKEAGVSKSFHKLYMFNVSFVKFYSCRYKQSHYSTVCFQQQVIFFVI